MTMMNDLLSPSLKQDALGDFEHELATTRRVLERLPEDQFGWKPHEKSMSLGRLATHVSTLLRWQSSIFESEEFDIGGDTPPPPLAEPASRAELLRTFDGNVAAAREALDRADEATLRGPWSLRQGEKVLFTMPRVAVIRTMVLNHMINHRAQLCVYLRLLNIPVPAIYGPSADERAF
jgi:uncharacterized damage-inducible protein DinB